MPPPDAVSGELQMPSSPVHTSMLHLPLFEQVLRHQQLPVHNENISIILFRNRLGFFELVNITTHAHVSAAKKDVQHTSELFTGTMKSLI